MSNAAIIVAGGKGTRAGAGMPKQFVEFAGEPMIFHTLRAFRKYDPEIKIIVEGGETRSESVKAGLDYLKKCCPTDMNQLKVAIHDAARPLVSPEVIARGMESVRNEIGAVPVVPAVNSLRKLISPDNKDITLQASVAVDRNLYVEVQTPQVFYFIDILKAYQAINDPKMFTDDASIAEAAGMEIALYHGDHINMKVTNPMDFAIAEKLIASR